MRYLGYSLSPLLTLGGVILPTPHAQSIPLGIHEVSVVAREFAYNLPRSLPAGVTRFRLRNEGTQPHHLMLYRLDTGRTLADALQALAAGGAHPAWMHPVGGPNAAAPRGGETIATVRLEPGSYVAFCHIPSPDHVLHFAKGMIQDVVVTPDSAWRDPLPRASLVVTLQEYGFTFSAAPHAGPQRIAVVNAGTQPHELILSKLRAGKTAQDHVRWMETQEGPPPITPAGGITDIAPGDTALIEIDLSPGTYAVICRVRDLIDHRPHDRHGMITGISIPRSSRPAPQVPPN